jgi:hypothetical protein
VHTISHTRIAFLREQAKLLERKPRKTVTLTVTTSKRIPLATLTYRGEELHKIRGRDEFDWPATIRTAHLYAHAAGFTHCKRIADAATQTYSLEDVCK